jgi:hypothetical protein
MKPSIGAEVQLGAKLVQPHHWCSGAIPYIGNAPLLAPTPPPKVQGEILHHPLNRPGVIRFALSQRTTNAMDDAGPYLFAAIGMADSSVPDALQGRRIVHALPCSRETLEAVCGIVEGTHKATKIRKGKA